MKHVNNKTPKPALRKPHPASSSKSSEKKKKKLDSSSWRRLRILPLSENLKTELNTILKFYIKSETTSLKPFHFIKIGHNSVMKNIEQKKAEIVCINSDSPMVLHDGLIEACLLLKIPLVIFNKAKDIPEILKVKQASCFSVNKYVKTQSDTEDDNVNSSLQFEAELDRLKSFLVQHAYIYEH